MNKQETQWAGEFGNEYVARNRVEWEKRAPFWQRVIDITSAAEFLEVGVNAGWNLRAIRSVSDEIAMTGIDVNHAALLEAAGAGFDVEAASANELLSVFGDNCSELVFTAGVLIHIPPEEIHEVMRQIAIASKQFVVAIEYPADREEEVNYRGNADMLWRRPYGDMYQALGFDLIESGELGEADGFGDGCKFWILEKA